MRKNTSPQKECVEMITSKKKKMSCFFKIKKNVLRYFNDNINLWYKSVARKKKLKELIWIKFIINH